MLLCFQANFESDIRSKYLELLGYNKEELALKVKCFFLGLFIYLLKMHHLFYVIYFEPVSFYAPLNQCFHFHL